MQITELKNILLSYTNFLDNNFLQCHCELLCKYIDNKLEYKKFKTQNHHIIPVCYYKHIYNLKSRKDAEVVANNDKNNILVTLDFKNHILAHYYLCLCTKDWLCEKLSHAFMYTTNSTVNNFEIKNLDKYEEIYKLSKQAIGNEHRGVPRTAETKYKLRIANLGKTMPIEVRKKISEAEKGKKLSEETKQKIAEAHIGKYSGENSSKSKKVICIETQQIFGSAREASRKMFKIDRAGIARYCNGKGFIYKGYHFAYLNDIKKQNELREFIGMPPYTDKRGFEISANISKICCIKKIKCITTGEIFKSLAEAAKTYNIKVATLSRNANGYTSYSGKLADGTKLHWRYI